MSHFLTYSYRIKDADQSQSSPCSRSQCQLRLEFLQRNHRQSLET